MLSSVVDITHRSVYLDQVWHVVFLLLHQRAQAMCHLQEEKGAAAVVQDRGDLLRYTGCCTV